MTELEYEITLALQCANDTTHNLRRALNIAGSVQGLALLPLIERALTLSSAIGQLLHAVHDDENIDPAILAKDTEPTP